MKIKRLVVDTSNIFWRAVSAQKRYGPADTADSAGLGLHMCLNSLKKHYNNVKPQKLAIVFEGKQNWRKEYTKSAECLSQRVYKANRIPDPGMASLFDVLQAFQQLAREHTNIVTLTHPRLEGDDLIAGYAQHYAELGDEVTILSADKDFVGLLGNPNIKLLNPETGKNRTLTEVCGVDDAGYFIFEKCFRGDTGDNVLTAFPRVRTQKLYKAYGVKDGKVNPALTDAFEMSNLMNSTWEFVHPETGEKRTMLVGKMFEENMLLMDLHSQPQEIKDLIKHVIMHESENHGTFNFFKFSQFLGKYKLKEIAEKSTDYVPMFSGKAFALNTNVKTSTPDPVSDAIPGMTF